MYNRRKFQRVLGFRSDLVAGALVAAALRTALSTGACILALSAAAHYQFLSAETDTHTVELILWERYGERYSKVRFGLLVTEKSTGEERQVEIDNLLTGIERLEIAHGMALAFGDVQGHFDGVTLVRLATAEVEDFILSYGSELSPSKRYLVFRGFYPPRGMAAARSDVVMVYDLTRSKAENRLPDASGDNVGLPVYPPENVDPPTYRVWVPEESRKHHVDPRAGFLWTNDEQSLFFLDKTGSRKLLVRVDLEEGPRRPRISTSPIDPAPVLALDRQSPAYSETLEREREYLSVTGLKLEPDGRITLELDGEMVRRKVYRWTQMTLPSPPGRP